MGKVLQQDRACMTRKLFLTKADAELAHFSDYLLFVHSLSACHAMEWGVNNPHVCRAPRYCVNH